MADTAISAGEFPTQHREHLPRQQPQQPLRRNTTTANTPTSTATPPGGGSAPPATVDTAKYRSAVRPLSMTVGPRDANGIASMGPHPGAGHPARANSTGSGMRTGAAAYDRQQSYLQQRASGTPDERVFNANGQQAAAAKVAAAAAAGIVPHREVHYANEYQAVPAAPQPVHRSSGGSSRRMVGPYQLAKTIGAGSMGKVKVALDIRTNKRVAAKIIPRQQPDVPIYFPSGFDTTASGADKNATGSSEKAVASAQVPSGPIDPAIEPWRSWLIPLALESRPDLAEQSGYPARIPRKLRLLQPRERFTTKDRERRENKDIRIVREVAINRLLHHPNICVLHDVVVHPNHYYIFQELVSGGQMLDYIISHGRLKEKHARKFARQIASAIDYCHRNSIVHRDLKIENILISANGNIKLIDFGLSNLYSPRSHLSTFCGSLYFAAPELLNAQPYTGPEVDLWSFGVVLYVLVCGKVPFDDQSMPALHAKIKRGHVEYPGWLSSECKHLLSRLLVVNPLRRATMGEVIRHPWTGKGYGDLGIPNSFLPERTPLVSPDQIDRAVVREMSQYIGFGFGTEEEIRLGLEAILTEDWYRCWLKDKLSPQINVVRGQVQEDISRAQAMQSAVDVAADQLGNAGAKGLTEGSSHVPLSNALSQSLTSAESASGTTLTNPNDTSAAAARLESAGTPAAPTTQAIAAQQTQTVPANSTIGQRLAAQTGDLQSSDAVKKKTSFWKRSSTFITTNIGRTSNKQHSPDPHMPGGQAAEKSQGPSQFRVLSGKAFGDLRSSASQDNTAIQKRYGKPSSAHAPQMYIDPATGMVSIWRDGKLAPPDTDCAAIQHEYHDLLATDPLLSIYFLVKERRDRETRAITQLNAVSGGHYEAHVSTSAAATDLQAVPQPTSSDGPATVPEKRHYLQPQQSQPLPRRPSDHKHELRSRTSTVTSTESYRSDHDSSGSRNPQQTGFDIVASLTKPHGKDTDHGKVSTMPSVPEEPATAEDLTTAAIEALSSHTPPRRRSLALTATNSSANAATAATTRPDTKKKRASLFKRFSTLVKGGRSEQKSFDTPSGSGVRLSTDGVREDIDFVEIVHEAKAKAKAKESDKPTAVHTATAAPPSTDAPASAIASATKPAALNPQTAHKYQALHCIDEDEEDSRDADELQTNPDTGMATNGTDSRDGSIAAASDESPDTASAKRQYLNKPLIEGKVLDPERPAARLSTDLASSRNSSRGRVDVPGPSQVPPPPAPPMHPDVLRAKLDKSAGQGRPIVTNSSPASLSDSIVKSESPAGAAGAKSAGAHDSSAVEGQSRASRSSNEFDAGSSMFTGTDIDDYEVITQSSLADHAAGPDRQGFDGIMAGKAELVEKARREIENMDAQEGVGLLDQTPELSYRVASSGAHHTAFDSKKNRVRSSSNAMARVIGDIVRDGKPGGGQRAGTMAKLQRGGKRAKEDGQPLLAQRHSFMNVAQHSSTGAIDSSKDAKIPISGSGDVVQGVGLGLVQVENTANRPFDKSGRPSGLLRSHSHPQDAAKKLVSTGLDLPEQIAEMSEPPTPMSGNATDGTGVRLTSEPLSITASTGSADPADTPAPADESTGDKENITTTPPIDLPEMEPERQHTVGAVVEEMTKAPRADEYLKPVSLKALFSATTTSTRSPSEIRAGLIAVMNTMHLRFHEGKGYFTCSMVTSVGPTNLQDAVYAMHADTASKNSSLHKSMRLGGIDRKLSFRRRRQNNRHEEKASLIDGEALAAVPGGGSGAHSIAESGVSENREAAVVEGTKGISVCFQIFMVRVPLLQLYGLQFRRVSGPTWKYKDICSEILERLKL